MINKFLILILFTPFFSHAQSTESLFLSTTGLPHYIIEIDGDVAQVITFSTILRLGGHDEDHPVVFFDTLTYKGQNPNFLFTGKKSTIKNIKGIPYLDLKINKYQSLKLDSIPIKKAYYTINRGIWAKKYFEMEEELKVAFPLLYLDYRIGRKKWKAIEQKDIYYKDFFAKAEKEITILRDSITNSNQPPVDIANHILKNISTLSYEDLKAMTLQLPMEPNNQYLITVINATCENQPEYFYRLVNDLPIERDWLLGMLKKKARKKIRKTKTNSPVKKEYLRYRRKDITRLTARASALVIGQGVVIYGIIWLIKR